MDKNRIEIVELKPKDLRFYEGNAKKHKDLDVNAIMESIKMFGFNDPIGIWGDKNIVVEGHGRLIAAERLGLDVVPCIRLDFLTDEERRAYGLAHNKTAELSEWDEALLSLEMNDVGFDWSLFGFGLELIEDDSRFSVAEFDVDGFSDERFDYECEECGFRFNP